MAYNNYFPANYAQMGYGYQQFQQPMQQYQNMQYGQQSTQQIQNGGFVSVRGIEEAYNWPVAPGNSIMFKDENAPYVYTKTKGFSQLDQPVFERYRLVKEDDASQGSNSPQNSPKDAQNYDNEIKLLWDEINALKGQINASTGKVKKPAKKEAATNDAPTDGEQ